MQKCRQAGAAALAMAIILMIGVLMLMVYAVKNSVMQQKSVSNQYGGTQAFAAADAGLEFGIQYLSSNYTVVSTSASGGYINYGPANANLTNVALSNGSHFSVVYTNPTQNDYQLIKVTSTGTSPDGVSQRVVSQLAYAGVSSLQYAVTTQGDMQTHGTVDITGTGGADVGGNLSLGGNSAISTVTQNDTTLANLSSDTLFSNIFGMTPDQMKAQSTYYANSSGVDFSSLSGIVWINSDTTITSNFTIGTVSNPVLLIVNGDFKAAGTTTFNGLIYVMGTSTLSGTFNLNGGLVSQGDIKMTGTSATYNASVVGTFTQHSFAKVPGSWSDF